MHRMMKWALPVLAVAFLIGWSGLKARADDAPKLAVGTVNGTILDKDGRLAANVTVNLVAAMPAKPPKTEIGGRTLAKNKAPRAAKKTNKQAPVATATTAADGTFTMAAVPVGDYTIEAGERKSDAGFARKNITVKEGDNVNVQLKLTVGRAPKAPKPVT